MNAIDRKVLKRMLAEEQFAIETADTNDQAARARARSDALTDFNVRSTEVNKIVRQRPRSPVVAESRVLSLAKIWHRAGARPGTLRYFAGYKRSSKERRGRDSLPSADCLGPV